MTPDESLFDSVSATVTDADGTVCELCVWLAATDDQQGQGLMHVTDLAGRDAMAFVFPAPRTTSFWMKDTPLPLSIAFFGADGLYLDSFDMEPCTSDECPTYPSPVGFSVALEVPQGTLAALGIGTGSTLSISGLPCDGRAPNDP